MSQIVEIASNIQRKFFALNVRRNGPQPSIFVRTFRSFTTNGLRACWLCNLPCCSKIRAPTATNLLTTPGRSLSPRHF